MPVCYYCGKRESLPALRHRTSVYRKIDSSLGIGILGIKRTTKYYEKEVEVERCVECYKEHKKANKPALLYSLFILVVSGAIAYLIALRIYIAVISGIAGAILTMIFYFAFIYRRHLKSIGIRDQYEIDAYPQIRELLDNGWSLMKP